STDDGRKLIQLFIEHFRADFSSLNPLNSTPLAFDSWWIDRSGDLLCLAKNVDLFVYLCNKNRYPTNLNNINIVPHLPSRLPVRYSILLKFINNQILIDEIKSELGEKYKSIYAIEEINGGKTNYSRHLRMDVLSKNEYDEVLNSRKICLQGQLFDATEYLQAPRLLICARCNVPGYTRKNCNYETEICRRCGQEIKNKNEHIECNICCQHCGDNHLATDYKCPFIAEYRKQLDVKLKKHPNLLPDHVQIFIPTECREKGEKLKYLMNTKTYEQQTTLMQNRNDPNTWPLLPSTTAVSNQYWTNNSTPKSFQNEFDQVKNDCAREMNEINKKFDDFLQKCQQELKTIEQQML
ncbi:unnamed protein product, partial [Didymodactylos carnosus]